MEVNSTIKKRREDVDDNVESPKAKKSKSLVFDIPEMTSAEAEDQPCRQQ